jgi:hypothetical protein
VRRVLGLVFVCALSLMPVLGCSEEEPECRTAEDCDDGNECTEDYCSACYGGCRNRWGSLSLLGPFGSPMSNPNRSVGQLSNIEMSG